MVRAYAGGMLPAARGAEAALAVPRGLRLTRTTPPLQATLRAGHPLQTARDRASQHRAARRAQWPPRQAMSMSPNGYGAIVGFGRDKRGKGKKFNQQRSARGLHPRCILREMSWEPLVMFSGQLLVRVCPNKLLARFCIISESCSQQALWGV